MRSQGSLGSVPTMRLGGKKSVAREASNPVVAGLRNQETETSALGQGCSMMEFRGNLGMNGCRTIGKL